MHSKKAFAMRVRLWSDFRSSITPTSGWMCRIMRMGGSIVGESARAREGTALFQVMLLDSCRNWFGNDRGRP